MINEVRCHGRMEIAESVGKRLIGVGYKINPNHNYARGVIFFDRESGTFGTTDPGWKENRAEPMGVDDFFSMVDADLRPRVIRVGHLSPGEAFTQSFCGKVERWTVTNLRLQMEDGDGIGVVVVRSDFQAKLIHLGERKTRIMGDEAEASTGNGEGED